MFSKTIASSLTMSYLMAFADPAAAAMHTNGVTSFNQLSPMISFSCNEQDEYRYNPLKASTATAIAMYDCLQNADYTYTCSQLISAFGATAGREEQNFLEDAYQFSLALQHNCPDEYTDLVKKWQAWKIEEAIPATP